MVAIITKLSPIMIAFVVITFTMGVLIIINAIDLSDNPNPDPNPQSVIS
jgi:hypothetical protein